ncbi:MAG: hypothetical protein K9I74_15035 [Bacteroidales bacterium]|nr:hypothetical protein [Bacteroidales bacterium]
MKKLKLIIGILIILPILNMSKCKQDDFFNQNLIKNGNAEQGPAVPINGSETRQLPNHWSDVEGEMWISKYGEGAGGGGIADSDYRGEGNYFWGGKVSNSIIEQTIDVSSVLDKIDDGNVTYELSGLLGGWRHQNDRSKLLAEFLDSDSTVLDSAQIGPVTNKDRDNNTRMVRKESSGIVPEGTRSIRFRLTAIRVGGTNNDGYADELSMVLHH